MKRSSELDELRDEITALKMELSGIIETAATRHQAPPRTC
jgi:hypothetical protein